MGNSGYVTTIGIECHVQFNTKTKLFAGVGNDAREAAPNTLISHICLGMPGALPVLNEQAVEYAMQAAIALGTEPQAFSTFDRKHYFYPDLPMGYQITQFYNPIIKDGSVTIQVDGEERTIGIHEAHLESDAGKSTHPTGKDYSLVDLNRAGTPLLEIVSRPDIRSPKEARVYARELWLLMRYSNVSDADLYYGNMRFDVNVSVSKDPQVLGTRTETKNLNSFKSVEKAAEYEIKRQIELLEKGEKIVQETRGWDEAKQKTVALRSKEEAHDYRYMPDPDLPPIVLSQAAIETIKNSMPTQPSEIRSKLKKAGIDDFSIETLLDEMPAGLFMATLLDGPARPAEVKRIANWLVGDVLALISSGEASWKTITLDEPSLISLAGMTESAKLSSTGAKTVLLTLITAGGDPEAIAKERALLQVSDESAILKIVDTVLAANPQAAQDVQAGEMKAIGFLVGQVMKESKGQANPGLATQLIKKQLGL